MTTETGQTHSIGVYLKIWGLLFVLSGFSYAVDFYHLQGYLRWTLILVFMMLKAGLIIAVFMHMKWERLAFVYAIMLPPILLAGLFGIGVLEGEYVESTRAAYFSPALPVSGEHPE